MATKSTDKVILTELRALTKDKTNWQTAIADVASKSLDSASSTLSTGERQQVQLTRAVRNETLGILGESFAFTGLGTRLSDTR